jgi:hypothetical protein
MTSFSLLRGEHYTYILKLITHILMGALFVSFWLGTGFYLVSHYPVLKEVLASLVFLEDYNLLYEAHEVNRNIVNFFIL